MRALCKRAVFGIGTVAWLLTVAAWPQSEPDGLEHVLTRMDAVARSFRTAEASIVTDQYQKVVDETETEKGKIYFRREGVEIQMAADFAEPDKKYVVYSGGKVQVYQPKIDQVNEYDAGKNRSDIESFLVLGFGGGGHDLLKSYDVKFLGSETVNGVATEKLELIPKSTRLRNNIARIWLWIDSTRGILVQQQLFEPGGDYRLAKYSDIQINQKLPENAFKLKTTPKTRFVSPQGQEHVETGLAPSPQTRQAPFLREPRSAKINQQNQAEKDRPGRYTAGKPPKVGVRMAKVFTITVPPDLSRKRRERTSDPRYVDGQKMLVEAMKYLAQADPINNREAIELLSEHVRTRFRMTDSPLG